jgi:hypothetical protein
MIDSMVFLFCVLIVEIMVCSIAIIRELADIVRIMKLK